MLKTAIRFLYRLVQQAKREIRKTVVLDELLQQKTWDEVQAMFGATDITQTRVYQDGVKRGKLETIPKLYALGLTAEQIAQALDLEIELIQKIIASQPSGQM